MNLPPDAFHDIEGFTDLGITLTDERRLSDSAWHLTQDGPALPQNPLEGDGAHVFVSLASATPRRVAVLRNSTNACRVETGMNTGEAQLIIKGAIGKTQDRTHEVKSAETAFAIWSNQSDDPSSTRGESRCVRKRQPDDLRLRKKTAAQCHLLRKTYI